ncbi:L,D-transpeptidase [Microbacterium sp. A84]|uniref:L,D-transpeptidase n=1 Tax=Microbacterium sp. A84 TaxID=3450715 RepID=UPI003F439391
MTDLIAAPGADTAQTTVVAAALPPNDGGRPVEWAPREPAPKKRHVGLWVGLGTGVLLLAAGAASVLLIAPGTSIAGVQVGGLTPGAAADVVSSHLANLQITITDIGDEQVITGADLGASIDARTLADEAFMSHPMWNLGSWMPEPITGAITLDTVLAGDTLRALIPASFTDAIDAEVVFDAATAAYVTTPAVAGTGINLEDLTTAVTTALADGDSTLNYSGAPAEAPAAVSDDEAASTAESLNTMLGSIGFYVGEERTVPVAPDVAATWLEVVDENGALTITADASAIQGVVDTLPAAVNRAAVNAEVVTNSSGDVLRTLTEGATGREVGDVSNAASDFAQQLEDGNAVYALNVNETAFETTALFRRVDLNLSTQTVTLYENETVIERWPVSTGLPNTPTPTGNFTVFGYTSIQDMVGNDYVTPDVPWNTWFAPDIAFHGAYWHENFGQQMSHGCVNMPVWQAEYVYEWTAMGTQVAVHW